jgi:hypothetical protein
VRHSHILQCSSQDVSESIQDSNMRMKCDITIAGVREYRKVPKIKGSYRKAAISIWDRFNSQNRWETSTHQQAMAQKGYYPMYCRVGHSLAFLQKLGVATIGLVVEKIK